MSDQNAQSTRESVRKWYDEYGWREGRGGLSGEDRQFRSSPQTRAWRAFAPRREQRVASLFERYRGDLLIVGGGDLPDADARIAERFDGVTCVDISAAALEISCKKLGPRACSVLGSITDADMRNQRFDAALASHVIYHIHADEQEAAVRRMISLMRPGGRVVIIYSNPTSPSALPGEVVRALRGKPKSSSNAPWPLYFHAHSLRWWRRFADQCQVSLLPWAPLGTRSSKLVSNNTVASAFFAVAKLIEDRAPGLAVRLWHYPIVVLDVR